MMYPNGEPARVVVAVDFGETNSAVAYTSVPQGTPSTAIPESRVKTIRNYPSGMVAGKSDRMSLEVPTQLLYPQGWVFRPLDELRAAPPGPEIDGDGDSQMNDGSHLLWGYQVLEETMQVTSHSGNGDTLLYGFKTFMDRVYNDEAPRHHIIEALTQLGENNLGRKIEVHEMLLLVTIDFLTKILKHAKNQIMQKRFIITSSEIVICVPVIWSQRALRNMQTCMSIAAKLAGFPGIKHEDDCIGNIFIVSEPEAAATWLLAQGSRIRKNTDFTILDAGGGTCDALTYTVTRELPVRLRKQPIRHSGDYCGSKALNEGVHRLVYNLLKDHTYLEKHGVTIAGITRKLIDHDFDKMTKPSWSADVENYDWRPEVVGIRFDPGNPNAGKYNNTPLVPNRLTIRACLEARLARINAVHSLSAEIYRPDDNDDWTSVIDAVAKGGVCRALNKENGPIRKLKSSYGVGRYEVYDPDVHRGQKTVPAFHNGKTYVSTIRWVCKMNEIMPAKFEMVEDRIHTFPYWNKDRTVNKGPFFCTDEVYVSDSAHLDHLSVDDEHNEGSEMICILKNEITRFYKPELGAMSPFKKRSAPRNKKRGRAHWEFQYQLVYVIDGLNMRCFQRYNGEIFGELKIGCAPGLPSGSK
ncbi:Ff.00g101910.m01.CDS01 [Fusarium sp. VM40]|nr:Ff.00g101910.m01.CDS01 [Fusarium sp. VM40]